VDIGLFHCALIGGNYGQFWLKKFLRWKGKDKSKGNGSFAFVCPTLDDRAVKDGAPSFVFVGGLGFGWVVYSDGLDFPGGDWGLDGVVADG